MKKNSSQSQWINVQLLTQVIDIIDALGCHTIDYFFTFYRVNIDIGFQRFLVMMFGD